MGRWLWLSVLAICLAGCVYRDTQIQNIGVFRLKSHTKTASFIITSSTWPTGAELCSTVTGKCIEGNFIEIEHAANVRIDSARWIIVSVLPRPDGHPAGPRRAGYMFDTRTGRRLSCLDCSSDLDATLSAILLESVPWKAPGEKQAAPADQMHADTQDIYTWGHKADSVMVAVPNQSPPNRLRLLLLRFAADGVRQTDLSSPDLRQNRLGVGNLRAAGFSPDDSVVAWQVCGPRCTLRWRRIDGGPQSQRDIHCEQDNARDLRWTRDSAGNWLPKMLPCKAAAHSQPLAQAG
ncbi:hypothetical protein [Pseudomonas sp. CGJS7]|uniref:hypothetical protein n=1 Tax=Pseudomonas sp. CGJS7 TaxID=3109348 RepID=UPI0030080A45